MKIYSPTKFWFVIVIIPVLLTVLTGCSDGSDRKQAGFSMAPMDEMPAEVKAAPVAVRESYQFAVANHEILQQIPCYCGCGAMGHSSNFDCYVSDVDVHGKISFDTHALGCSICVDITQDTMRLLSDGKTVPEIKAYVDQTYSQYGSSNIP